MTDTRYALVLLDEPDARFPLAGSVTVGRHLDNDLVIAGEDVRDFHVRIETNERGPRVIVLEGATAHIDDTPIDGIAGLRPGVELILGQHRLRARHRNGDARRADGSCIASAMVCGVPIAPALSVGRATDCDLQLVEGHVSRHHARVARGTTARCGSRICVRPTARYVNGDRIAGRGECFMATRFRSTRSAIS